MIRYFKGVGVSDEWRSIFYNLLAQLKWITTGSRVDTGRAKWLNFSASNGRNKSSRTYGPKTCFWETEPTIPSVSWAITRPLLFSVHVTHFIIIFFSILAAFIYCQRPPKSVYSTFVGIKEYLMAVEKYWFSRVSLDTIYSSFLWI